MLFLIQATLCTVHSPDDDGMSEPSYQEILRLVSADNVVEAKSKLFKKVERDESYKIRVSCEIEDISEVIT